MKSIIYVHKATGFIQMKANCNEVSEYPETDTHIAIECGDADVIEGKYWSFADSAFLPMPPRPTQLHEWSSSGWVDSATTEEKWKQVRLMRDGLLKETDWVVIRSTERNEPVPADASVYRQQLRDVTQQTDPYNIQWPIPPASVGLGLAEMQAEEI